MTESLFTRRRLTITGLAVATLTVLVVHPTWASALGVDVWNVPALEADIRANAEHDRELQGECEEIQQRIRLKEAIVIDLIAGRTTLADATDRFAALNQARPEYRDMIRSHYPGKTDHESLARSVIAYAESRLSPAERPAVSRRLESELHQMLSGSADH